MDDPNERAEIYYVSNYRFLTLWPEQYGISTSITLTHGMGCFFVHTKKEKRTALFCVSHTGTKQCIDLQSDLFRYDEI